MTRPLSAMVTTAGRVVDAADTPRAVRKRVASEPTTTALRPSKIQRVPMLTCPRCGIRQYTAASYVTDAQCVACDAPLARAKVLQAPRSESRQMAVAVAKGPER